MIIDTCQSPSASVPPLAQSPTWNAARNRDQDTVTELGSSLRVSQPHGERVVSPFKSPRALSGPPTENPPLYLCAYLCRKGRGGSLLNLWSINAAVAEYKHNVTISQFTVGGKWSCYFVEEIWRYMEVGNVRMHAMNVYKIGS